MRNPTPTLPPMRLGLLLLFLSTAIKGVAAAIPGPSYTIYIIISVVGSIVLTVIVNVLCCYCRKYSTCCQNDDDDDEEKAEPAKTQPTSGKVAIVTSDGKVLREAQPATGTNEKITGSDNAGYESIRYMQPQPTANPYEELSSGYDDVRGDPNQTSPKRV